MLTLLLMLMLTVQQCGLYSTTEPAPQRRMDAAAAQEVLRKISEFREHLSEVNEGIPGDDGPSQDGACRQIDRFEF